MADQRARERGLAGAEVARQRDEIAGLERSPRCRPRGAASPARSRARSVKTGADGRDQQHCVDVVRSFRLGRRLPVRMPERENAGHGGAAADGRIELTVPPCSSTKERTIDRPRPAPRWCEPSAWVSNQSNTRSLHLGRNAGAAVGDAEHDRAVAPLGRRAAPRRPAGEKPTALDSRLNSTCRTRRSSATKLPMSGGGAHVEQDRLLGEAVLHARAAASMRLRMSTSPRSSVIAPASMVARSRMSLMIASSAFDDVSM